MSYSFSVRGADKAAARAAAMAELDNVVEQQPIHAGDRPQAEAALDSFLALIGEPGERQEVSISMNGSVYRVGDTDTFDGAGVGVNVSLASKIG